MGYDSAGWLLPTVAEAAMVPTASALGSDAAAIYRRVNAAIRTKVLPAVLGLRQDHLLMVAPAMLPIIGSKLDYRVPSRGAGGKVRKVTRLSASGGLLPFERATMEETVGQAVQFQGFSQRFGYALRGAAISLINPPTATTGEVLRVDIEARPNEVVDTSACWQITAVHATGVWDATGPAAALASGSLYDVVRGVPNFEHLAIDALPDATATITGGVRFTFNALAALADFAPAVGDWICPAAQAPVIQLPLEVHDLVARIAAADTAAALGNASLAQKLMVDEQTITATVRAALSPRDESGAIPLSLNWEDFPA